MGVIDRLHIIDDRIKYTLRTKYRSGHRIHSPYVFNLVRSIFMKSRSGSFGSDAELTVGLCQAGLKYDYSYRIGQFFKYNHFKKFSFNPMEYHGEDMIVVTSLTNLAMLDSLVVQMRSEHKRSAVVVLNIYRNKECRLWWRCQHELSLDIYRLGILIYDNDLNKEYFKLKI